MAKTPIKNALSALLGFLRFPFPPGGILARLLWVPHHIADSDWNGLLASARRLHKWGYENEYTWFWHSLALAKLGRWHDAQDHFEKVSKPLDPVEVEADRWCWHAYVLYKLGRVGEGKTLLEQTDLSIWPKEQQAWAKQYLTSAESGSEIDPPSRP